MRPDQKHFMPANEELKRGDPQVPGHKAVILFFRQYLQLLKKGCILNGLFPVSDKFPDIPLLRQIRYNFMRINI